MFFICMFLILFQFSSQTNGVKLDVCSQVFIAPVLSENYNDPNWSNWLDFEGFLTDCAHKAINLRNIFVVFNFAQNNSATCLIFNTDICEDQAASITSLEKYVKYSIKGQLEREMNRYENCLEKSVLLIFTDIKCGDFISYPDIEELFGPKNINKTSSFLFKKRLQTYLFFMKDGPCDYMNFNFDYNSNYLYASKYVRYLNSDEDRMNTDVCTSKMNKTNNHKVMKDSKNYLAFGVTIGSGIFFAFLAIFVAFWATRVKRRWGESKIEAFADEHTKTTRHILFGKYKDEWEVTPKELKVEQDKVLGQGMFGKVYLGHLKKQRNKEYFEMDVAVKFTHETSDEKMRQEMIEEIGFMKALGSHKNLLVMVGYVKSIENPVICTIYCPNGDLLGVLKKHELHFMDKEKCQGVEICLLLPDLLRIAIEVCDGLIYLSSHGFVHRDIAARNVLLTENMTAKLSDFGLCKKLELHEICIIDKNGKFPIKYMCYESLKFGEFSLKTDVWSFGILMWEMFSGGQIPFKEILLKDFVKYLESDGKPIMSELTPQPIQQLLNEKIFQKYPSRRADFKEIKKELENFYFVVCNVLLEVGKENSGKWQ